MSLNLQERKLEETERREQRIELGRNEMEDMVSLIC
jgi:hypothetical protein